MKIVIWDFDGSLVHTLPGLAGAIRKTLANEGVEVTDEEIAAGIGAGARAGLLRHLEPRGLGDRVDDAVKAFRVNYTADPARGCTVYDGIRDVLEAFEKAGFRQAINTAKFRLPLLKIVDQLGIAQYFDYIVSYDDIEKPKPDPEGALKVLSHYGIGPAEAVYIGDAATDIGCAHNAGIKICLVTYGYGDLEKNMAMSPDAVVDRPAEITEAVYKLLQT